MKAPRIRIYRDECRGRDRSAPAQRSRVVSQSVSWRDVFGNDRPVEVEIGCGRGGFLVAAATASPDRNFLGIERVGRLASSAEVALERAGATNVRVLSGDARCVIRHLIQPGTVSAYHIYFPDPWWKRRHHRRRIYTQRFSTDLARTLATDGRVHVATDIPELLSAITVRFAEAGLRPVVLPSSALPTRFARRCGDVGRPIHQATFFHR